MKKRIILITSIVIGLSTFVLFEQAAAVPPSGFGHSDGRSVHMGGMPFGGHIGKVFHIMELLDLDQAQREEVWNILDEKRPQMRAYMTSLFEVRKQLRAQIDSEYDETMIGNLADAQGKTIANLIVLRTQTRSQVYSILTPEQQSKLSEFLSGHRNDLSDQVPPLSSGAGFSSSEDDTRFVHLEEMIQTVHMGKMFPMMELFTLIQTEGKTTFDRQNGNYPQVW